MSGNIVTSQQASAASCATRIDSARVAAHANDTAGAGHSHWSSRAALPRSYRSIKGLTPAGNADTMLALPSHDGRRGKIPSKRGAMPVHDWTRVDAGIFHHFHHAWIAEISSALNR